MDRGYGLMVVVFVAVIVASEYTSTGPLFVDRIRHQKKTYNITEPNLLADIPSLAYFLTA